MADILFKKDFSSESLSARLLSFIERYRIANPPCVAKTFFRDTPLVDGLLAAKEALEELFKAKAVTKLKGNSRFAKETYILADAQIKEGYDLARLWYCTMSESPKQLLTYEELKGLFHAEGQKPPHQNYAHAISPEPGGDALFRIYWCQATTLKSFRTQLGNILATQSTSYRGWVDDGSFGVAILVHTESKAAELRRVLEDPVRGKAPFNAVARITVSVVPDHEGYASAVKALHDSPTSVCEVSDD
ncbi:hypothetical protein [Botrimarina mediterranea]|uniref:Uncharacterized protein n=1 Tax=Botrimarina mediterranea TaxID=2528022 RepID=A0A518K619_9BACT|nr:hypothetical protein [Botrimarina mediterranea]QDV73238.1 hypothetical protein Spa11_14340 [Botrimarina mediterranea]